MSVLEIAALAKMNGTGGGNAGGGSVSLYEHNINLMGKVEFWDNGVKRELSANVDISAITSSETPFTNISEVENALMGADNGNYTYSASGSATITIVEGEAPKHLMVTAVRFHRNSLGWTAIYANVFTPDETGYFKDSIGSSFTVNYVTDTVRQIC